MPRRKPATWHMGEHLENKARAEAKKPIAPEHSNAHSLVHQAIPLLTANQRRRARLAVASRAHDADDCAELLDALGLRAS